jgi:hypothetical protein
MMRLRGWGATYCSRVRAKGSGEVGGIIEASADSIVSDMIDVGLGGGGKETPPTGTGVTFGASVRKGRLGLRMVCETVIAIRRPTDPPGWAESPQR